jgi:hypothetical protein
MLNGQRLYKQTNDEAPVEYSAEDYAQAEIDYQNFITIRLPAEIRQKRNLLLKNSDWTQASDIPNSIKTTWATYRQELRDLPEQSGFPLDITFPSEPS